MKSVDILPGTPGEGAPLVTEHIRRAVGERNRPKRKVAASFSVAEPATAAGAR